MVVSWLIVAFMSSDKGLGTVIVRKIPREKKFPWDTYI